MVSKWPEYDPAWDFGDAEDMEVVMDAVRGIRNIRAEMNVSPAKKAKAVARVSDPFVMDILKNSTEIIHTLAKVEDMEFITQDSPAPHKALTCVIKGAEIFVPMEGLVDIETEIVRLQKEHTNLEKEIDRVSKKLSNEGFLAKAPQDVVEKERQKEKDYRDMMEKVEQRLNMLKELK
jgi:valyl-tRNA synthetase